MLPHDSIYRTIYNWVIRNLDLICLFLIVLSPRVYFQQYHIDWKWKSQKVYNMSHFHSRHSQWFETTNLGQLPQRLWIDGNWCREQRKKNTEKGKYNIWMLHVLWCCGVSSQVRSMTLTTSNYVIIQLLTKSTLRGKSRCLERFIELY